MCSIILYKRRSNGKNCIGYMHRTLVWRARIKRENLSCLPCGVLSDKSFFDLVAKHFYISYFSLFTRNPQDSNPSPNPEKKDYAGGGGRSVGLWLPKTFSVILFLAIYLRVPQEVPLLPWHPLVRDSPLSLHFSTAAEYTKMFKWLQR